MAFASTGILALAGFGLAATVHEDFTKPTAEELAARPGLLEGLGAMIRSRDLLTMFVVLMLARLTIGGMAPVTALLVSELDVSARMVPTVAGLSFSAAGVGAAITAPVLGRLSDRVGHRNVLFVALMGSAALCLPQAWVTSAWQLVALRFGLGLFSGGVQPAAYALVGRRAPRGQQSAAYGLTFSANALGSFTGPLLSGIVAASLGVRSVFVYTAALVAVNAAWAASSVRDVAQPGPGGGDAPTWDAVSRTRDDALGGTGVGPGARD